MSSLLFAKRFAAIALKNVESMSMNIVSVALKNAANVPKPAMLTITALLSLVKRFKYVLSADLVHTFLNHFFNKQQNKYETQLLEMCGIAFCINGVGRRNLTAQRYSICLA